MIHRVRGTFQFDFLQLKFNVFLLGSLSSLAFTSSKTSSGFRGKIVDFSAVLAFFGPKMG